MANVSADHMPNDLDRMIVAKALLYAKSLKKLSEKEIKELMTALKDAVGRDMYQKILKQAQAEVMVAIGDHLEKISLNGAQEFYLRDICKIHKMDLQAFLKKVKDTENEFSEELFSELIRVIRENEEQSKIFFKENPFLEFGLAEEQESRVTIEQVLRGVGIIILIAVFIAGMAMMASAVTGAVLPRLGTGLLASGMSGITVTGLTEFLGLSNTASYLGISKVTVVAIQVFESLEALSASSSALRAATGLVGLGLSYGSFTLGFSKSITEKIQDEMSESEILKTKIGEKINTLKKKK
jgi:hypothetical protein